MGELLASDQDGTERDGSQLCETSAETISESSDSLFINDIEVYSSPTRIILS
jgi:chromosome segregation ATPase